MQVKEVMTPAKSGKTAVTVNQNESIDNAANLMREHKMKSIAVVDDDNNVVGKITRKDIVEASDDLNEDFFFE